jgi:hypothetical protein
MLLFVVFSFWLSPTHRSSSFPVVLYLDDDIQMIFKSQALTAR